MLSERLLLLGVCLSCLIGCSDATESPKPVVEEQGVQAKSWREDQLLAGQATYEKACASCHSSGSNDAPVVGDREAWSGRSDLWVAVLAEHANSGYLDMPEKGGHGELTEEAVNAAFEYMMYKTFPERPRD